MEDRRTDVKTHDASDRTYYLTESSAEVDISCVIFEDLPSELDNFVRLTRHGQFEEAERCWRTRLGKHRDRFIVSIEWIEFLNLKGDFAALKEFLELSSLALNRMEHERETIKILADCVAFRFPESMPPVGSTQWTHVAQYARHLIDGGANVIISAGSIEVLRMEFCIAACLAHQRYQPEETALSKLGTETSYLEQYVTCLVDHGMIWEAQRVLLLMMDNMSETAASVQRRLLDRILSGHQEWPEDDQDTDDKSERPEEVPLSILAKLSALNNFIWKCHWRGLLDSYASAEDRVVARQLLDRLRDGRDARMLGRPYIEWKMTDIALTGTDASEQVEQFSLLLDLVGRSDDPVMQQAIRRQIRKRTINFAAPLLPRRLIHDVIISMPRRPYITQSASTRRTGFGYRSSNPITGKSPWWFIMNDLLSLIRRSISFSSLFDFVSEFYAADPQRPACRMSETARTVTNIAIWGAHAMFLHAQMGIISIGFFGLFWLPSALAIGWIFAVVVSHPEMFALLNGSTSRGRIAEGVEFGATHHEEFWMYLNGDFTVRHWHRKQLRLLSDIFRRPIHGQQLYTSGILFDIISCIFLRHLQISTRRARMAYWDIRDKLEDSRYTKVVIIMHGSGAIIGSQVMDWLLADGNLAAGRLGDVEIYTFGSAANHFSNPLYFPTGNRSSARPTRAIGHIEHYALQGDPFARLGPLNRTFENCYQGLTFRIQGRKGCLLNQHYLSYLFPLDETGRVSDVAFTHVQARLIPYKKSISEYDCSDQDIGVIVKDADTDDEMIEVLEQQRLTIRNFSRLWQYCNGEVPIAKYSVEEGVRR